MQTAYIAGYTRSAIGNINGGLSHVRPDDLMAYVIKNLIASNPSIDTDFIDDVMIGCANQAGEDNRNVARMSSLLAGLPFTVPAETINRLCASGMSAAMNAARSIFCHENEMVIAGGVESMTRAPYVLSKSSSAFGRDVQLFDTSFGWRFINPKLKEMYGVDAMGETAENLAEKYAITRDMQDEFALNSQLKASTAQKNGVFSNEITPISIPQKKGEAIVFDKDEFIKPQTSSEGLSKLKPAFKTNGSVTAGNASGLNDGAAVLLICNEASLIKYNLKPIARIVSGGVAGVEPRIMGIGPVEASAKALRKAQRTLDDMDIIEINEAFAAQVLACLLEMKIDTADQRLNPNGGAIALGHPLGMSGARIIGSAALQLQRSQKKYALCTMCIGVGQGYAVVLERV